MPIGASNAVKLLMVLNSTIVTNRMSECNYYILIHIKLIREFYALDKHTEVTVVHFCGAFEAPSLIKLMRGLMSD